MQTATQQVECLTVEGALSMLRGEISPRELDERIHHSNTCAHCRQLFGLVVQRASTVRCASS